MWTVTYIRIDMWAQPFAWLNNQLIRYNHFQNRMWRKTRRPSAKLCYGADANRNFDFHFAGLSSITIISNFMDAISLHFIHNSHNRGRNISWSMFRNLSRSRAKLSIQSSIYHSMHMVNIWCILMDTPPLPPGTTNIWFVAFLTNSQIRILILNNTNDKMYLW